MSIKAVKGFLPIVLCFGLLGCLAPNAQRDIKNVQDPDGGQMTVGDVQREIHVGMSGADIIGVLGSPNIVTTDDERNEVWTYDKVSTQQAYSKRSGGILALILSGGDSGAKSSVQKTLTIIIKFDKDKKVKDFKYHFSQF